MQQYNMSLGLVDFHCHLDLYPNPNSAYAECERLGIHTLSVTTTPKAWLHNRELASDSQHVRLALGLHPQLIRERAAEVELWEKYLVQTHYVGEVGLDASPPFYNSLDLQKQVFARILDACHRSGGKILSIHSIRAAKTVLDMLEKHHVLESCFIVLHWFTGTSSEAKRAIDMGCYFSINAEMLRKEHHRKLIAKLPIDRILTETDGAFTKHNGISMRPADIKYTVELLAQALGIESTRAANIVLANLNQIESFT